MRLGDAREDGGEGGGMEPLTRTSSSILLEMLCDFARRDRGIVAVVTRIKERAEKSLRRWVCCREFEQRKSCGRHYKHATVRRLIKESARLEKLELEYE